MADPLDILTGTIRPRQDDTWSTLAGLAQAVASIPERRARAAAQRAQMEAQAENAQIRRGQLQLQQQQLADREETVKTARLVNGIASKYIKPAEDGSYKTVDRAALAQALSAAGAPPETMLHYAKLLDEIDQSSKSAANAKDQDKADLANSILKASAKPGMEEVAFALALAKSNHADVTDEQLAPFYEAMATGKDLRPLLVQIRGQFDRANKYKDAEESKGIVVPAGGTLANQATGEVMFKAPAKAPDVNVGSFEDYAIRYAAGKGKKPEELTPADIEDARKRYQQADDRPSVTVRMPNGMTPGQAFEATRKLRNDYERETKSAKTVNQQLAQMKSSLQAVKSGASPAGSQGVLVTFQKILDPTSVVRESEYARSASGLSLLGRIEGAWEKIKSGGAGVGAKDLEQFVGLAEQFAKSQNAFAQQSKQQIEAIAKEYGLNPENITKDYSEPTAEHHTFSVAEVQNLAKQSGHTYAEVKAELERKGHVVK